MDESAYTNFATAISLFKELFKCLDNLVFLCSQVIQSTNFKRFATLSRNLAGSTQKTTDTVSINSSQCLCHRF